MSRRIDIELTSTRDDGTWTWRAVGAKQPKGALDGSLLPGGAAVGHELRADVETTLDGTDVLAVLPPKTKNRAQVETIELTARPLSDDELVIETRAPRRGGRDRGDREDKGKRGDRRGRSGRDGGGGNRGDRPGGGGRGERSGGPRGDRPSGDRPSGDGPSGDRSKRSDRPRPERQGPPPKPKAKRLRAGRAHRKTALDALAPEEQVIAEQLLRGGVPAVRQAVDKMNEQAKAEGRPQVKADPLVAIAERLLPGLRSAEWLDKAEAALADIDELDLRDLRSVVVASETGAKDDESRALAAQLRDGLTARVDREQAAWQAEIAETLADGRVVRALRLSSRPPKAGAPLPGDLAGKLAEAASGALTAETVSDRWATVLDALSFSPVRLTVVPGSKPDEPNEALIKIVTRVADRVPKVAEAFGIEPVPAKGPKRSRSGAKSSKGAKKGGRATAAKTSGATSGGAPIPPPPTVPFEPDAADQAATDQARSEPTATVGATPEPVTTDQSPTDQAAPAETTPEPTGPAGSTPDSDTATDDAETPTEGEAAAEAAAETGTEAPPAG